jgi:hypothetical protein
MDPISALSEMRSAEIAAILAIRALKGANMQQKAILSLLTEAVESAQTTDDQTRGDHIDLYA